MKIFHSFLWICFVGGLLYLILQPIYVASHTGVSYNMIRTELASQDDLFRIFSTWKNKEFDHRTLFHYGRVNLWIDFFFIIGYVGAAIMVAYTLMQREKNPVFNNVIRFCFPLAVLIGLLDIVENIILLYDMHVFPAIERIHSSIIPSSLKWLLSIFLILILLIAAIRSLINKNSSRPLPNFKA